MSLIKVAAVHRPGKARTGVTTYAAMLKTALAGFAEMDFLTRPPQSGYDLIHIIDIKHASLADVKNRAVPVIADLHDYYWAERRYFPGPDAPLRWFMSGERKKHYQEIIQATAAVVVHSMAVARHVQGKKVFLVPLAIDFEKFFAEPNQNREQLILLVGRDSWRKGLGTLISALKMITADFPGVRVEVVGKEYLHTRVWAKIIGLGLNLKFIGELSQEQLKAKYQKAQIVYLGSWQEGFGLSLAEGMAAGCIAVGSTAGGIPELVEDGISGILFTAGDDLELSAKLRALLETAELRQKLSISGQRRVKEMLTMDKMREALLAAYREVLKLAG